MNGYSDETLDYYGRYDDVDRFEHMGQADEIEPWWERFYDERDETDDYEGYRDEVEQ